MDRDRLKIEPVKRIGRVFPVNQTTLIGGLPGCGKSVSTLSELNADGIIPIYFNLDPTPVIPIGGEGDPIKCEMFGRHDLIVAMTGEFDDLYGQVVVIDTYTRLIDGITHMINMDNNEGESIKRPSDKLISDMLEAFQKKYNLTLIVIGHTTEYVGKDSIFKDNEILVRNCFEFLYFSKEINTNTDKKTKVKTFTTSRILYVNKGRGYVGDFILLDFGRPM